VHYPVPLHLQPAYAHLGHREGDFPVAERICREILSLPIFPEMTEGQADQVVGEPLPLWGVLDNLRSAFNVGSIFRTSEAARISGLVLCGITPYPPNERLDRTALGTVFRVPWVHRVSTSDAVRELRARGIPVWACEVGAGAVSLRAARFPRPVALVFGHETGGVAPDVLALADGIVEIPLYGRKNSLNVATAYGVVLFEVLRQWGY
jgi:tRNA G18 (ribose-2'-O)-methylase SpoU